MRFIKLIIVFTVNVLTTANPVPEESIFSDLSDLSSNFYRPDSSADPFLPLAGSSLLDSTLEGFDTIDFATIDGSDDGGASLFTQDFSIADNLCSSTPNGLSRKRDNMKCDSTAPKSPSITIPQLPNLLDLIFPESSQSESEGDSYVEPLPDAFKNLPADDAVVIQWRLDPGECLEPPFVVNLCCDGPWLGDLPGIRGTVYSEIRKCFYSECVPIFQTFFPVTMKSC